MQYFIFKFDSSKEFWYFKKLLLSCIPVCIHRPVVIKPYPLNFHIPWVKKHSHFLHNRIIMTSPCFMKKEDIFSHQDPFFLSFVEWLCAVWASEHSLPLDGQVTFSQCKTSQRFKYYFLFIWIQPRIYCTKRYRRDLLKFLKAPKCSTPIQTNWFKYPENFQKSN